MPKIYLKYQNTFTEASKVGIKANNAWSKGAISNIFQKVGGTWTSNASLVGITNYYFGGFIETTPDVTGGTLTIGGASVVSATSCEYIAIYNGEQVNGATWSIISGGSYASISNSGVITINNSANNSPITIQAVYRGCVATADILVTYKGGSSAHTETTIDESGNTNTTTTTTNQDGSYNISTVMTDVSGNPINGSSVTGDTQGNINTQSIVYNENGEPYIDGYVINTENNPDGGETISGSVETGIIAFDGKPFTIHAVFKLNPNEQSSSNVIVSALEYLSGSGTSARYKGFSMDIYTKTELVAFGGGNSGGRITNGYFGSRISGRRNGTDGIQSLKFFKTNGGVQTITLDVEYYPTALSPTWSLIYKASPFYTSATGTTKQSEAMSTLSSNSSTIPQSLENAMITIGSYGVEHTHDIINMEVLEFEVKKILD